MILVFCRIKDYPNYAISNYGHVLNIVTHKYLKPSPRNKDSYLGVNLYNRDGHKNKLIHQLICEQFFDKPSNLHTIDHIDRNILNNQLMNLRYATKLEQSLNRNNIKTHNGKLVSCGFRGVTKDIKKYRVQIQVNGQKVYIGRYECPVLGAQAFDKYVIANNLPQHTNYPREFYLKPKIKLTLKTN